MADAAESYGLALLTEECGEVLQLIGKAGRFGIDTPGVKDPLTGVVDMGVTPRTKLVEECGEKYEAFSLNEKGQCPSCRIKPLVYKRPPRKFCHRCDRTYSLETGVQQQNLAWRTMDGGLTFERTAHD